MKKKRKHISKTFYLDHLYFHQQSLLKFDIIKNICTDENDNDDNNDTIN